MSETEKRSLNEYQDLFESYAGFAVQNYDKTNSSDRRVIGVRRWLEWCEESEINPIEATEDEVHQYIRSILNLADTSISARVSSVSMFYVWAQHEDFDINYNPTENIDITESPYNLKIQTPEYVKVLRREGKENVKALPKTRVENLFDHGGEPEFRNELLLRILWQTALRADEVSRIRLDNIDFHNREIKIRSAKLNPQDHPKLYIRRVYYRQNLDWLMEQWVNSQRPSLSPYAEESPYLFLTHQSEKMRPSHISRIVKDAAFRAGEQEAMYVDNAGKTRWLITAHRIRHSAISHWANETNLRLTTIRMLAGHAKLETTKDYVQTSWDQVRQDYVRNLT